MLVADLSNYESVLAASSSTPDPAHLLTPALARLRVDGSMDDQGPQLHADGHLHGDGGSRSRRGANMTECVTVPSSEHVAEIVGRQGTSSCTFHSRLQPLGPSRKFD